MSKGSSKLTQINAASFMLATDPEYMGKILGDLLPGRLSTDSKVVDLWIPRVVPRGKRGFAIQYNMKLTRGQNTGHENLILYGYMPGFDAEYQSYANNQNAIIIDEFGLVIPLFPYDPEFPKLADLFSPEYIIPVLAKCVAIGSGRDLELNEIRVLGYRLGRRCVVAYEITADKTRPAKFVAKLSADALKNHPWRKIRWLERNGFDPGAADGLTVPQICHLDDVSGAYFMEFVAGESLHDLIGRPEYIPGCEAAGKMLAKLHNSPTEISGSYSYHDELKNLESKFLFVGELFPCWNDRLLDMFSRLKRRASNLMMKHAPAVAHRDFYDKQVLYSPSRVTLLDCDGLTTSDPALDFGNFLAHLKLRARQDSDNAGALADATLAFGSAYDVHDQEFDNRINWWTAASLTRLACLYGLRPRWRHIAPELLNDAADELDQ
ncbi:MAG: hypothetical protein A2W25_13750 [candidate division Zixibacteria bacterium RBG_16_53_22]|nr:MAG: hypothetical protein A2W25_13750 [candidate division Zixibacteria bacterium RBG_16_53_22]